MADILIVDDESPVRELLARYLEGADFHTRQAASAAEALEAMAVAPADVVLSDIQMPGEHDGVWLTRELRSAYHATSVVLITVDETVPPATSLRAGVVAYVVKPFTRVAVLQAVRQAVAWHDAAAAAGPHPDDADALKGWFERLDKIDRPDPDA